MRAKKKAKKSRKKKWLLILGSIFILLIAGGCAAVVGVSNSLMDKSKVKDQIEGSTIYDRDGHELTKLYVQNRDYVDYQKIPPTLVKAFVNTEDARFYEHNGIDVLGIGRALYKDALAGGAVEGASTITQQLARNVYLSSEKSIWRKTKEALIALNLERNYSKEQILEFYLNEIYLGKGNYGVEAASKYYFGKDLKDLSISEDAVLAGLPKAPNTYNPIQNYDKSIERRNTVLGLMLKYGTISQMQYNVAIKEPIHIAKHTNNDKADMQPYIDYVLQEAHDKYGLTEDQLYRGGFKIYTELDSKAQTAMADAFKDDANFPESRGKDKVQAGMVILNPKTGGIIAMEGGRDYVTKGLNRAVATKRSPGSSIKPLAVYSPAVEKGWHPYDMLKDVRMTYPGGYTPKNYGDLRYRGEVTMTDALKMSLNAPAVWLLNEIGIETSFQYLKKYGIPYDPKLDRHLGIALGDITHGVSPLDMARAYSAFDNKGVIVEPHAITKIQDRDQNVVQADLSTTTVITEQTAYYMTQMMQEVVNSGTGKLAKMDRPVAGKTGTTEMEGTNGNRDAWFVGYTPELVGSIWMGYDKSDSSTNYLTSSEGSNWTAQLFSTVMSKVEDGRDIVPFPTPDGVDTTPPPPTVTIPAVQDLKASLAGDSFRLSWSANADKTIHYQVYRYFDDPAKKELIGDTDHGEWMDKPDLSKSTGKIHYFVIPYSVDTKQQGSSSNVIEISIAPNNGAQPGANNPNGNVPGDGTAVPGQDNQGGQVTNPGDTGQQGGAQTPPTGTTNGDQGNVNQPSNGVTSGGTTNSTTTQGQTPIQQYPTQTKKFKKHP
jgi:penicillin-binding protein 2A